MTYLLRFAVGVRDDLRKIRVGLRKQILVVGQVGLVLDTLGGRLDEIRDSWAIWISSEVLNRSLRGLTEIQR